MYNTAKKQVWLGELRTTRGTSIVIHDNQLPDASPGRIYLYNVSRNTIGEYVEDIVKANLHELTTDQVKISKAEHETAWLFARAEFLAKHQAHMELSSVPDSAPPSKSKKSESIDKGLDEVIDDDDSGLEFEDTDTGFNAKMDDDESE